ncbi:MAG: hypothetical protein HS104_06820 [Polyangiaceae bacterium]|nr:hypothetical protein [Polyangiaceae bacterium]
MKRRNWRDERTAVVDLDRYRSWREGTAIPVVQGTTSVHDYIHLSRGDVACLHRMKRQMRLGSEERNYLGEPRRFRADGGSADVIPFPVREKAGADG